MLGRRPGSPLEGPAAPPPPAKPLIAAVEGHAVAGGTEILQATHLRVAGESATFGLFEARRGLFPVGGSTVRLCRQIGYTHALEMLLTGRPYSAQEAKDIGLIGHVVPDGHALAKAKELAALDLGERSARRRGDPSVGTGDGGARRDRGIGRELEIGWPIFATADAKEGPRAFAEKRDPVWTRS